jgi:hypothetical protein
MLVPADQRIKRKSRHEAEPETRRYEALSAFEME